MEARELIPHLLVLPFLVACAGPPAPAAETDTSFTERWVSTEDSVRLYVRIMGAGPDTVLVPGGVYLERGFDALAAGRTLISYDGRGRGRSDAVLDTGRRGVLQDVSDLEAVRAALGVERASLIGGSYVGAVVALYAAEHLERVVAVVQLGPASPQPMSAPPGERRGSPPDSADLRRLAALERAGLPTSDLVRYCRVWGLIRMMRPMMGRPEGAARTRMDPFLHWNEWPAQIERTLRRVLPAGATWDYTGQAARSQAPVLTIHGTADPNTAVDGGRAWASLISNARLLEIEGVGHAPWLEAPEEFFPAADKFLKEAGG